MKKRPKKKSKLFLSSGAIKVWEGVLLAGIIVLFVALVILHNRNILPLPSEAAPTPGEEPIRVSGHVLAETLAAAGFLDEDGTFLPEETGWRYDAVVDSLGTASVSVTVPAHADIKGDSAFADAFNAQNAEVRRSVGRLAAALVPLFGGTDREADRILSAYDAAIRRGSSSTVSLRGADVRIEPADEGVRIAFLRV